MKAEYGDNGKLVVTQTTSGDAAAAKYFRETAFIEVGDAVGMAAAVHSAVVKGSENEARLRAAVALLNKLSGESGVWRGGMVDFHVNRSYVAENGKVVR